MAACVVASLRIRNAAGYALHVPAVLDTLKAHGAEVLAAEYAIDALDGNPPHVTLIIRFTSKQAARAWRNSADYQSVVHQRADNSDGVAAASAHLVRRASRTCALSSPNRHGMFRAVFVNDLGEQGGMQWRPIV